MRKNKKNKFTKKKVHNSYKGFTFLELSMVITIIGIMTGIGMVSLSSSRSNAKLKAAQSELASTIKLAQSYALQGKSQGGITPAYYGVKFFGNSRYGICRCTGTDSDCGDCDSGEEIEKYDFPGGVQLQGSINEWITFVVPHGNVNRSSGNLDLVFTLSILGVTQTKSVTVNSNGFITED